MRLDKYLKVSRLIKRRSVANDACGSDRVMLNGKLAKPSAAVSVGDRLCLTFGTRLVTVEITSVSEHASKADASEMYKVVEE